MSKHRTITLTGRRPVEIDEDEWPVIAQADWDSWTGHPGDQARYVQASNQGELDEATIHVRRNNTDAKGNKVIVYGTYTEGHFTKHDGLAKAGEVTTNAEVEDAIKRVGETLGVPAQLIADAIAALPPEQL